MASKSRGPSAAKQTDGDTTATVSPAARSLAARASMSDREALAGHGCEFVEAANVPNRREGSTYHALHEVVAQYTGPEHVTFWGHAKGITSEAWGGGVTRWVEALYETCLDHWPAVQRLLKSHPIVGSFKRLNGFGPESDGFQSRATWHYSGSWRWFRNRDFFSRNWRELEPFWCCVEAIPSLLYGTDEAACIAHEFQIDGLALYTDEYWQSAAGPAMATWREEHLADRRTPLLLTCILTSHKKPSYVHEAITSILKQTTADWQLIIMDSGPLVHQEEFKRYQHDPRIHIAITGETGELASVVGIQAWAINECTRRKLIRGNLICHLCDDDVYDPNIFAAWLSAARENPDQQAWYGPADRCELRDNDEVKIADLPTFGVTHTLDNRADGMQVCCRVAVYPPWPEDKAEAWHTDGLWMDELGRRTELHPVVQKVGRHRHTPISTFTKSKSS